MRRVWALLVAFSVLLFFSYRIMPTLPEFGNVEMFRRSTFDIIHKSTKDQYSAREFKKSKNLEEGSANVVTSIVVNYRSFDTLGEVTVLFISAFGAGLVVSSLRRNRRITFDEHNILKTASGVVLPFIFLFGSYVFVHGHLSPGGGFAGGTILALGVLLLMLARNDFQVTGAKYVEQISGAGYVVVGLAGLAISGAFLANFLPTGTLGELFSAGVVPFVYTLIGFKVGAELSGLISDLREGEV
ncbi:Na(+)/H(+) antiporter subunit B [Fervidobacterium thailandense]|uniref:Cation:proton antiporter n=1 Tax=Fervidobacterium thailandense TaxID=1008305 RepID=A0A1E3G369_9BACT|nr:Na(+)/H(+) antiporter subunit B [Fervidobacterium thailandense]ODN30659.1 cation:proton antiporter [Fervidobacterium thailandense]